MLGGGYISSVKSELVTGESMLFLLLLRSATNPHSINLLQGYLYGTSALSMHRTTITNKNLRLEPSSCPLMPPSSAPPESTPSYSFILSLGLEKVDVSRTLQVYLGTVVSEVAKMWPGERLMTRMSWMNPIPNGRMSSSTTQSKMSSAPREKLRSIVGGTTLYRTIRVGAGCCCQDNLTEPDRFNLACVHRKNVWCEKIREIFDFCLRKKTGWIQALWQEEPRVEVSCS